MPHAVAAMTHEERRGAQIRAVTPIIGLEVHVELRTRSKMFAGAGNPAGPSDQTGHASHTGHATLAANTLLDPVVLALPGALPVMNRAAVELSVAVGLALGCQIAEVSRWDRKSYTYPDLPKGYQISQYDTPLCGPGAVELPLISEAGEPDWSRPGRRVRIARAHLEEDAGKLLHEAPGGAPLDHSIVDLNRAGTPLLEIVTEPDFTSAAEAVAFCRLLRWVCRFVGATEGVLQAGHMRFEPNINCELTLADGRTVRTPIVEVKNLNSFRAVHSAIEHEIAAQPERWRERGIVFGSGTKATYGWDDARGVTVPQREKEDAQDYRYFPDPDLPVVRLARGWIDGIASTLPELPAARLRRYQSEWGLAPPEALSLIEDRRDADLFDASVAEAVAAGLPGPAAARGAANLLLQHGVRIARERGLPGFADLGVTAAHAGAIVAMRERGEVGAAHAGKLLEQMSIEADAGLHPADIARREGWIAVRDSGQIAAWCDEVLAAFPAIVEQVRGGKTQAVGRLIGEVMKRSAGAADAAAVRAVLLERIGAG